jgi:tRNA (guanine-N7-)-methyltransferase
VPHALHTEQRVRSFQPRKGRMSDAQRAALADWADYGFRIDGEWPMDLEALFGRKLPVVLEIGFGMGDATAAMAEADPGTGILAADVHTPGHGKLLNKIKHGKLDNVRLAEGDAVVLLRDQMTPASLDGIRIYFPDPWPKARHHKRRIIRSDAAGLIAGRLRPGGRLYCATDWAAYAAEMLEVLSAEPLLRNAHEGYAPRAAHRPVTKFEARAVEDGREVFDLCFLRLPAPLA